MDTEGKLLTELRAKLTELDLKVWNYQQDKAAEFEKYQEALLRNSPRAISETVLKQLTESRIKCKSLFPTATNFNESGSAGSSRFSHGDEHGYGGPAQSGIQTPATRSQFINEEIDEFPRDPHGREKEFQGVFTPSYLPLLDSNNRNERRSSYEPPNSPQSTPKGKEMEALQVDASTDTRSLASTPDRSRPPTPKRKNTDELSVASDASEGTARRSALRRSSSSSKTHSPRRVRFDFEGEEVLPTSSPVPSTPLAGGSMGFTSLGDISDEEAGSDDGGLLGDIDSPPQQKRIRSTDALRALSRCPLEDDGTTWTTVIAPADGSPSVDPSNPTSGHSSAEDLEDLEDLEREHRQFALPGSRGSAERIGGIGGHYESDGNWSGENDGDDGMSDEDLLSMASSNKGKKAVSILSPAVPADIDGNKSPTASTRSPGSKWHSIDSVSEEGSKNIGAGLRFTDEESEDELFQFDENDKKPKAPPHEEDDDSDLTEGPSSPTDLDAPSKFSQSPARDIIRPTKQTDTASNNSKGVVGSYKAHLFNMPIVSPELHAQAASFGPLNSFVGSVDGRSGVDKSDMHSFRASGGIGSYSGTPRSMSERMMLDDLMEAEESKKDQAP